MAFLHVRDKHSDPRHVAILKKLGYTGFLGPKFPENSKNTKKLENPKFLEYPKNSKYPKIELPKFINGTNGQYYCTPCSKMYNDEDIYNHILFHSCGTKRAFPTYVVKDHTGKFFCKRCIKNFASHSGIANHIKYKHPEWNEERKVENVVKSEKTEIPEKSGTPEIPDKPGMIRRIIRLPTTMPKKTLDVKVTEKPEKPIPVMIPITKRTRINENESEKENETSMSRSKRAKKCPASFKETTDADQSSVLGEFKNLGEESINSFVKSESMESSQNIEKPEVPEYPEGSENSQKAKDFVLPKSDKLTLSLDEIKDEPPEEDGIMMPKITSTTSLLESTMKEESPEEDNLAISTVYNCPICHKKYLTLEIATQHIEIYHKIPTETQSVLGLKILAEAL